MSDVTQVIMAHPFMAGVDSGHIAALASTGTESHFAPNEIIFRERDSASRFFLITSGDVAIEAHSRTHNTTVQIDTVHAGEVLGWSWLFPPYCWHFQARAIGDVTAVSLDAATLLVRCEEDSQLGFTIMKRIAQIVVRRLQHARQHLLDSDAALAGLESAQGRVLKALDG